MASRPPSQIAADPLDDDLLVEVPLRPRTLDEYVGQDHVRENLRVQIAAARGRGDVLDHVLVSGPPGLGKTSLAHVIATELGVSTRATSGPVLERPGDLAALLTNLERGQLFFIDEIHRLPHVVEETLYPAMEDFQLDLVVGQGPTARSIKLPLPPFCLVGATTRAGLLTSALRDRFGASFRLDFYSTAELERILSRSAAILSVPLDIAGGESPAAPGARLRAGARRRADHARRRVRRAGAPRRRPGRLRSHGPRPAAHRHRQVRRRSCRARHAGGCRRRGARHHRGGLRALPHPGGLPGAHAEGPRRHRASVRAFRPPRSGDACWTGPASVAPAGSPSVVDP